MTLQVDKEKLVRWLVNDLRYFKRKDINRDTLMMACMNLDFNGVIGDTEDFDCIRLEVEKRLGIKIK